MEYPVSPRLSPRRSTVRYERSSPTSRRSPSPLYIDQDAVSIGSGSGGGKEDSRLSPSYEPAINHRRNTLPKHSTQYLSPDTFSRARSNSYYNRSPSRRRRSFKEPSPRAPMMVDTWDNYAAKKSASRKMSLPSSEPLSPGTSTKYLNVIIVGDANVGKYSLIKHLVDDDTNPNQSLDKSVRVHRLNFPLLDTHVEIVFEYYQNVAKLTDVVTDNGYKVKSMDILIVMYSVTDRRSFEMSAQYLTMAIFTCKKMNPELSVCLLANKTDLVRVREVSSEEGRSLAEKFETSFIEVSVELEDNFEQIVEWMTNVMKEKLKIGEAARRSGLLTTTSVKKNGTLSERAFRFVRKILTRRSSKSKSCDNIHLMT